MLLLIAIGCAPPEAPPACPRHSGLVSEGRSWAYRAFDDDRAWSSTLDSLGGGAVQLSGDGWVEHYRCDADGLWLELRVEESEALEARWEYEPAAFVMPATLAPGDAWTASAAWRYSDSDGLVRVGSSDTQLEVVSAGRSNVTAGAFDTVEVHVLDDEAGRDTRYYAADVGLVLSDDAQLVSVED